MARILAVDDEKDILMIIRGALEKEGHQVTLCDDAIEVEKMQVLNYDLILLDVMMPGMDGFTLCTKIRERVDCPILFLTAKTMENDLMKGLALGGDDYITKPFGIGALRARVNAHLRREERERKSSFTISGITFQMLAKEVYDEEKKIALTKGEYEICEYLALNHGQVFSKEAIYEAVFGFDGESDSTAIVEHIKNIRGKLLKHRSQPIETVWGMGYKWTD
ncbi:MAG: response regulator transcription factor [Cellulosilyticaceae bacterium]